MPHFVRRALVAGFALALAAPAALAQTWPAKQIRIIVPYTPGGSSDIIARAIQQPLQDALKQTVIVENKPGANGNTGTDFVAKSPPDGYTILLCDVGALAITSSVYSKLPFDPAKDLVGITMLAYSPHLLVVHPSVAANNLKELVAYSKTGKLDFAVTAIGSAPHLAGVAVEKATGAKWVYIPYKGGSQAIGDTVAGQTQVLMNGMWRRCPSCSRASSRCSASRSRPGCRCCRTCRRSPSRACPVSSPAPGRGRCCRRERRPRSWPVSTPS